MFAAARSSSVDASEACIIIEVPLLKVSDLHHYIYSDRTDAVLS
jgi:hypothetical protein